METRTIFEADFDASAPKRIDSIKIVWKQDESPDTSYLGAYSSTPKANAIDRKERGDMGRNEYRYFNHGQDYADCTPEDRAKYIEQDYQRSERLNAGDWCYMGVWAEAEVSYPTGSGNRRLEKLRSGGLWGIESDSNAKYATEVEQEQVNELKEHIETLTGIEWPELEAIHA